MSENSAPRDSISTTSSETAFFATRAVLRSVRKMSFVSSSLASVIRFAGSAPTIAMGITPSAFNVGTTIGTGITAAALGGPLGDLAPLLVGAVGSALVLVVFGTLTLLDRGGWGATEGARFELRRAGRMVLDV